MRCVLVLVLALSAVAMAAPVPKETGAKLRRLFGVPVDPNKDCKIELVGEKLRITLPKAAHPLDVGNKLKTPPRVLRSVAGDFSAQVRVHLPRPKVPRPKAGKTAPLFKAGLIIVADEHNYVYHSFSRYVRVDRDYLQWEAGYRLDGNRGSALGGSVPGNGPPSDTWTLRVVRTGDKLRASVWDPTTMEWQKLASEDVHLTEAVSVGLFAAQNVDFSFVAELDEFSVRPLKDGR